MAVLDLIDEGAKLAADSLWAGRRQQVCRGRKVCQRLLGPARPAIWSTFTTMPSTRRSLAQSLAGGPAQMGHLLPGDGYIVAIKMATRQGRGGSMSEVIRHRRATRPPAHFHRGPLGRSQRAVCPRCSTRITNVWALRSSLENEPTGRRQYTHHFGDRTPGVSLCPPKLFIIAGTTLWVPGHRRRRICNVVSGIIHCPKRKGNASWESR